MEVKLRAPMHGSLMALMAVISLGTTLLAQSIVERKFIRRMDDEGVQTRSGKRIAWSEFTAITRAVGSMHGVPLSNEYLLSSKKGRVSLPLWRAQNAREASEFLLARLPPNINKESLNADFQS